MRKSYKSDILKFLMSLTKYFLFNYNILSFKLWKKNKEKAALKVKKGKPGVNNPLCTRKLEIKHRV